jgi:hypothetical protein
MSVSRRGVSAGNKIAVAEDIFMAARLPNLLRLLAVQVVLVTFFALPTQAALTVANGVSNPPSPISDTIAGVPQTAIAYTAKSILASDVPLQKVLDAQGFTNANKWTLNTNTVQIAEAVYNLTQYTLANSPGVGFGEKVGFSLIGDLLGIPAPGANETVTLHWLQTVNTNAQVNGYGFSGGGLPAGVWQADNGQKNGAQVDGTNNGSGTNNGHKGPYYDSNYTSDGNPAHDFSVPPGFFDFPHWYAGVGTYLIFSAFPTWDVYNSVTQTDTMYVASEGVQWGFYIVGGTVPEPAAFGIWFGLIVIGLFFSYRRRQVCRA